MVEREKKRGEADRTTLWLGLIIWKSEVSVYFKRAKNIRKGSHLSHIHEMAVYKLLMHTLIFLIVYYPLLALPTGKGWIWRCPSIC